MALMAIRTDEAIRRLSALVEAFCSAAPSPVPDLDSMLVARDDHAWVDAAGASK
jgi:hypothetical protein